MCETISSKRTLELLEPYEHTPIDKYPVYKMCYKVVRVPTIFQELARAVDNDLLDGFNVKNVIENSLHYFGAFTNFKYDAGIVYAGAHSDLYKYSYIHHFKGRIHTHRTLLKEKKERYNPDTYNYEQQTDCYTLSSFGLYAYSGGDFKIGTLDNETLLPIRFSMIDITGVNPAGSIYIADSGFVSQTALKVAWNYWLYKEGMTSETLLHILPQEHKYLQHMTSHPYVVENHSDLLIKEGPDYV